MSRAFSVSELDAIGPALDTAGVGLLVKKVWLALHRRPAYALVE